MRRCCNVFHKWLSIMADQLPAFVEKRKLSTFALMTMALLIIAMTAIAWQWLNTRHRFTDIEKSLSLKLDEYQTMNQKSLALAKQAEERSAQANARIVLLEQKLAESRDQQEALQTLYTQLAESRESTAVAEVEQLLTTASQQLQLVGNVKAALLALQAAHQRLDAIDLPRAVQLREVLSLEIENLRELPQVDVISMSNQLTHLSALCGSLPLLSERQPTLNASLAQVKKSPENLGVVQKFAYAVWDDIKSVITVERIDQPEAPLLTADHAFYLRENIKLRLLTARMALLQHDEMSYKADLAAVELWLNRYFDTKHPDTIKALNILKRLSSNNISIELPQLSESFAAVNRYKLSLEKSN